MGKVCPSQSRITLYLKLELKYHQNATLKETSCELIHLFQYSKFYLKNYSCINQIIIIVSYKDMCAT